MYVSKPYYGDEKSEHYWRHMSSRYSPRDPRGRSCLYKRHFLVAPDGRVEEVDDDEMARGAIPLLEIEQLR